MDLRARFCRNFMFVQDAPQAPVLLWLEDDFGVRLGPAHPSKDRQSLGGGTPWPWGSAHPSQLRLNRVTGCDVLTWSACHGRGLSCSHPRSSSVR